MIKKKKTNKGLLCAALGVLSVGLLAAGSLLATVEAKAEEGTIYTDVKTAETWDNGTGLILYLTKTDYMTAEEWSTDSAEAYKWVNSLTYEDRKEYNVCNAILDKNLDAYNYAENIFIDGVALKEYTYTLVANRYTRVDSLGILFPNDVLSNASEILINEGCQLPSLTHSYFGESYVELVVEEPLLFKKKNGNWVKGYPFDGYEAEVEYDASEKFFYLRNDGSTYKAHAEAATFEFTNVFSVNGWGDDGFTLASTAETQEGKLFVAELVHPIDATKFNTINVRLFSNVERSFAAYNASKITEASLGDALEIFTIPEKKFTTISLPTELYADENGKIDTLVFKFLDNGSENYQDNQFFLGSFTCLDDYYRLSFRFHQKGELTGEEKVDFSKLSVNGERLDVLNLNGARASATWSTVDGYYQIDVKISKSYTGAGEIVNADLYYTGNRIQAQKGMLLPNGESLDRTYTYHIYENECLLDYELIENYEETHVTSITASIDEKSNNNVRFRIVFDKKVIGQPYYHACESEEWRDKSLIVFDNMYDKEISDAFIAGGFKAALYDKILINGKSIGEWHAIDDLPTCVHTHYGQTDLYTLDMSVDSYSEMYAPIYEAFINGEDIVVEVKSGMKFTTGMKTERDYKFTVRGYESVTDKEKSEMSVFYDGKRVEDGDLLLSSTKASEHNIHVQGVSTYTVSKTENGNVVSFAVTDGEGNTFAFSVQEELVNELPKEKKGCSSSASTATALPLSLVLLFIAIARRKRHA